MNENLDKGAPASQGSDAGGQSASQEGAVVVTQQTLQQTTTTIVPTSKRQAFRDVRRQLSDDDLKSPGVQKLLLDELERAENECEEMAGILARFHEADKRAAILDEKMRATTALEIFFGVGVGLGGTILGLAPTFWDKQPQGVLALAVGVLLTVGAAVGRVVKR